MDIIHQLVNLVVNNPVLQGGLVKLIADQVKALLERIDAMPQSDNEVKVMQAVVAVLSFLATAGGLLLQHKLGTLDVASAITFITVYLSAVGTHQVAKDVRKLAKARSKK